MEVQIKEKKMAFEPKNFVVCSKFQLFRAGCNLWLYTTDDSTEDCLVEGYFQPRMNTKNQDSPDVGDIIQCIVGNSTLVYLKITAKTEKPYNITVQRTYLENEQDIYNKIDLAANSGSQLYRTGVWFAKMHSETVAPSADDDTNYADFSQTDSLGNPIIVIYERQSGAWVEIERITPPADYNGYITVTSKIWDITEQSGQQGGEVLWSHNQRTFTPYPKIISFESIHVTGDSTVVMPNNPSGAQIVNKDYVDAVATGAIVSNFATNCITEIPQDIKLELAADGTLTLKAGSKVYVPNGAGVFNEITIASDLTTTRTDSQDCMVWYDSGSNVIQTFPKSLFFSDATAPTQYQFMFWYDTTNNQCKITGDQGVTWTTGHSFPLAILELDGTQISAIKQVFNGFGYVGSTVFALPGVSCLMPNGRNADGTLNSASRTSTTVVIATDTTAGQRCVYFQGDTIAVTNTTTFTYNETDNYYYYGNNIGYLTMVDTNMTIDSNGKIASFTPKTAFHAVDYSDYQELKDDVPKQIATLLQTMYPVGSIYIGTQASCPLTTLIPGSTWTVVATKIITDITGIKGAVGTSSASGNGKYFVAQTSSFAQDTVPASGGYNMDVSTDQTITGASVTNSSITVNVWSRTA